MIDNFSDKSKEYALYRPSYPREAIEFLIALVEEKKQAWDCGTGNGQFAVELAEYFDRVWATDLSANQIKNAVPHDRITYKVEQAENAAFPENSFDLISVAQAIHWFDFDGFYPAVKKVLKPEGIFVAIGYSTIQIPPHLNEIIHHFYTEVVGKYWDKERRHIDAGYQTIPFPFREIETPAFEIELHWTFEQLIGYLNTWSSVKHYISQNRENPVDIIQEKLKNAWGGTEKIKVIFPIILRVGKKGKA
ncbi:class I SAM-dependent methyltransferase [Flexithrix dorotheae]|uniref:class I SAM-dependent methyltransferase n=1 Tax=Flexithrix dorotheae TaxID=70993 RepID=UPI000368D03F|nr:class I SAM-dependent methyltransferase [Flexithrix dorotheae]